MRLFLFPLTLCCLLHVLGVRCDDAASSASEKSKATEEASATDNAQELSRVKRGSLTDMRRLGRGIQMLRLGKRGVPMLRLGRSFESEDDDVTLEELLNALQNEYGYYGSPYYYPEEENFSEEEPHRFRRSADASQETVPSDSVFAGDSAKDVKRSVQEPQEEGAGEDELFEEGIDGMEKRPMNMLRLGKRPMNMLRLGKRPMNMLRLGKRPMNMLRLGKRPMNMLRLGKRPMNMLRLGKRPMNMLRLGKRDGEESEPIDEEEFYEPLEEEEGEEDEFTADKRPMNMLRLGKRPMNMLRLGKRPMNMLRLGKRPMNMLRLGKRPMNMLRLGKRPMNMLRLGKRDAE